MISPANSNKADINAENNNSTNNNSRKATGTRIHDIKNGAMLVLGDIVVALLLFAGVLSIYEGLGINFRILEYPDLRAYGIPIGLLLLCLALAAARFWVFELDRRGSDLRPVGTPLGTPPGPRPGMMPQVRFVPPGTSSANENRAPGSAVPVSSSAVHGQPAAGEGYLVQHTLDTYDATALVGLRTTVHNGAIESIGDHHDVRIDLPNLQELRAAAAILRCILPIRLRGFEIRALREIIGWAPAELMVHLGEKAPPKVLARWESEALSMDELTEKRFRQLVCEQVRRKAPHIDHDTGTIAAFKIVDPWSGDQSYELPPVVLNWVQVKQQSGTIDRGWNDKWAA